MIGQNDTLLKMRFSEWTFLDLSANLFQMYLWTRLELNNVRWRIQGSSDLGNTGRIDEFLERSKSLENLENFFLFHQNSGKNWCVLYFHVLLSCLSKFIMAALFVYFESWPHFPGTWLNSHFLQTYSKRLFLLNACQKVRLPITANFWSHSSHCSFFVQPQLSPTLFVCSPPLPSKIIILKYENWRG